MSKRGIINPALGVTDANLRSQIRSALRRVWRNSSRRAFLEAIRFPYKGKSGRGKFGVSCALCGKIMGQSEKAHSILKDGSKSKRRGSVYEVDHIVNNAPFTCMDELGAYANDLIYGEMRILCVQCHKDKTHVKGEK